MSKHSVSAAAAKESFSLALPRKFSWEKHSVKLATYYVLEPKFILMFSILRELFLTYIMVIFWVSSSFWKHQNVSLVVRTVL